MQVKDLTRNMPFLNGKVKMLRPVLKGGVAHREITLYTGESFVLPAKQDIPRRGYVEPFPASIGSGSFGAAKPKHRANHGKWRGERDGRRMDQTTARIAAWSA